MHYEAYVHVCAVLWKTAFEELRGLTNKKSVQDTGVGLNPMELNDLYDHLWNMGALLLPQYQYSLFSSSTYLVLMLH